MILPGDPVAVPEVTAACQLKKMVDAVKYGTVASSGDEKQLPALFIVAADGTVRHAHYAADLSDMPSAEGVLAILDRLAAEDSSHEN